MVGTWIYNYSTYSNELYHYGVLGMKWGVRRQQKNKKAKNKKHLGIDDKGNINLIDKPTSKKGIKNFAIRSGISIAGISLSLYMSKHPEIIAKGVGAVSKNLDKMSHESVKDATENSIYYSNSLGRMLTVEEAINKGLMQK